MVDSRFHYDDRLVEDCSKSGLADFVFERKAANHRAVQLDQSCVVLFTQHAVHYTLRADGVDKHLRRSGEQGYEISDSLRNFVRNLVFVHEHNQQSEYGFTVALNRFAHLDLNSVLASDAETDLHQRYLRTRDDGRCQNQTSSFDNTDMVFEELSEQRIHQIAADMAIGHGAYNKMNPKKHKKEKSYYKNLPDVAIEMPMNNQDPFEATYAKDGDGNGALYSLRSNPNAAYRKSSKVQTVTDANEFKNFSTYLNWATNENPDGVPIVHDAFDQGACGSCWAFAAAGSLEASAARHEASLSFQDSTHGYHNISDELQQGAIARAQSVEMEAFQSLNLSIQELLDCDIAADQGCTGGNPLLAFYFIHRYGLASWEDYPYTGSEDTCKKQRVRKPVASVRSWGVISPNHEKHMELALRYIGPIAVGINGGDHSFLTYSGGIFDSLRCKQGANHALLIVGYGEDADNRWWIARNSWGKGWGENGFVRVARRDGSNGLPGVCGIARSPSVALGGFLLEREGILDSLSHSDFSRGSVETLQFSPFERMCQLFRMSLEGKCGSAANWIDYHHAYVVGFLGIFLALLSIWPLSSDWRRKRRLQRLRKDRQDTESNKKMHGLSSQNVDESTALLS